MNALVTCDTGNDISGRLLSVQSSVHQLTYVGKHLGHGRLHHPFAILGLLVVDTVGDMVIVNAASVLPNPVPGVLVLE